jgi:LCP family protein required for cell wall assembly
MESQPPAEHPTRPPAIPEEATAYPVSAASLSSARGTSQPAGAPPLSARAAALRQRNRRLRWVLIPTIIIVILAATGGALAIYYGPLIQLIQSSTGHTIARSTAERGIAVPTDILSGERVNILLLGSDNDTQKFTDGNGLPGNGVLTQTVIIASLDPNAKTIDLLSIPRDSWINLPGTNSCLKLDEAAGQGKTPDEAIQLERTVVERDYGIPIWRYAWVGLAGFVKVIDTLGGVDVDVLHPIVDDEYPNDIANPNDQFGYTRLYIPAGPQHLDGATALEYVRSRHADANGDFGRSQRQQSVLIGLEKKLKNTDLIAKIPDLATALQGNVLTDMTVTEITQVANFARGVTHDHVKQYVFSPPDYSLGDGLLYRQNGSSTYAVAPNWDAITQTVQAVVHPDPSINQNQPCAINPVPGQWSS